MSNDYFNAAIDTLLTRFALGRAEQVNAIFAQIAAGFEKLPSEAAIKQARVTHGVDTGAANAYVVTLPYPISAYVDGLTVSFIATNGNTGPSTINVDGNGVVSITDPSGSALASGDIPLNGVVTLRFSGTGFQKETTPAGSAAAALASATAAADSATTAGTQATAAAGHATTAGDAATDAQTAQGLSETARDASQAAQALAEAATAGIYWKAPVLVSTTANITLSGEQTIDGVLTSASRVLVPFQSDASENGIYVSAAGAWTRATPLDTWAEFPGAAVIVKQGSTYADTAWLCTVNDGGTLGVTDITWDAFGVGDMRKADNLAGLADKAAARGNLDLLNSGGTDNALLKQNGTTGGTQTTGVVVDNDNNMTGHGAGQRIITGTTGTIVGTDNGKTLYCTNASLCTLTVPQTSTEAIAAGFQCTIVAMGAAGVALDYEGTDTGNGSTDNMVLAQWGVVWLNKYTAGSPNAYIVAGV